MPIIKVRMEAFANGEIREVEVPDNDAFMSAPFVDISVEEKLQVVFHYGQNDHQPQHIPSVSVGDVILLEDEEYGVTSLSFKKLCKACNLGDMCYPCWCDSYYKIGEEQRHKHSIKCERCE